MVIHKNGTNYWVISCLFVFLQTNPPYVAIPHRRLKDVLLSKGDAGDLHLNIEQLGVLWRG